ncbi:MAG: ribonuclease HI [Candidatus Marinamargulisbacteria bacterium]|jgi:ribonuclease HI
MTEFANQALQESPMALAKLKESLVDPLKALRKRVSKHEFTNTDEIVDIYESLFDKAQKNAILKSLLMIEAIRMVSYVVYTDSPQAIAYIVKYVADWMEKDTSWAFMTKRSVRTTYFDAIGATENAFVTEAKSENHGENKKADEFDNAMRLQVAQMTLFVYKEIFRFVIPKGPINKG